MYKKTNITMIMMALAFIFSFPVIASAESIQMNASSKIAPTENYDLGWLKKAKSDHVCMVTNKRFTDPQIAVDVDGKTYYGCCQMCKGKLEASSELREATDPISGNVIDKSMAVIGYGPDNSVYYFENEENMQKFDKQNNHH